MGLLTVKFAGVQQFQKFYKLIKRSWKTKTTLRNLVSLASRNFFWNMFLNSPRDRGQIAIKLGTKHVMYQKLANFM